MSSHPPNPHRPGPFQPAPPMLSPRVSGPKLLRHRMTGEKMRVKDKVAIITGGAHGMGECEARLFAGEGAKVVIADVLQHEGEAASPPTSPPARRRRASSAPTSPQRPTGEHLIDAALAAYGRLDILVNNAGSSGSAVGDHDGLEGWNRLIAVNATSVHRYLLRGGGHGGVPAAGRSSTSRRSWGSLARRRAIRPITSKAAVRNYTKAAACRYGPLGVRVNSCTRATCRRC